MKANELRIGNLVKYNLSNIPQEIKSIISCSQGYYVNFKKSDFANSIGKIQPIQLTEEWLLKFGFVKKEIGYSKLTEIKECFSISFGKHTSINAIKFNNEVKYVHQLQNIYFALTGEELTI